MAAPTPTQLAVYYNHRRRKVRLGLIPSVGAAFYAPSPAPAGFHWEFVYSSGALVVSNNTPVVALVGN